MNEQLIQETRLIKELFDKIHQLEEENKHLREALDSALYNE